MRPRRTDFFLTVALAGTVLLAACSSSPGASPTGGSPSEATLPGTSLPASPTALPTYSLDRFKALLTDLKGTPVLVNYWASWCGPCIAEAPTLASLARQYQGKVQFIGVDVTDTLSAARAFVTKYGWIYPSVADPTGSIRNGMGFVGQPVTVLYDATGKQVLVVPGTIEAELPQLRSALDGLG